jgi:hypothetical protein
MHRFGSFCVVTLLAVCVAPVSGGDAPSEKYRFVRPMADKHVTECEFDLTRDAKGWAIASRTGRMKVETRYDKDDRLQTAKAVLSDGKTEKSVTVQVKDGRAKVERDGAEAQEFDVPKGTIVTSAPDWSDVFLLCRCFDRTKNGKREFPALWIHPEKPARRLTFAIEKRGTDSIERDGKAIELGRYLIHIRDNSAYVAWADADGRMIRLIPLPAKDSAPGMTLEGYEKATSGLRPRDK